MEDLATRVELYKVCVCVCDFYKAGLLLHYLSSLLNFIAMLDNLPGMSSFADCTPEFCDYKDSHFAIITGEVIRDCVHRAMWPETASSPAPNKYAAKMRIMTAQMRHQHQYLLRGMVRRLETPAQRYSWAHMIRSVADEVFGDGTVHWGRIVSLFAFVECLAGLLRESSHSTNNNINSSDQEEDSFSQDSETGERLVRDGSSSQSGRALQLQKSLVSELELYMNVRLKAWIESHGGWNAFLEEFADKEIRLEDNFKVGSLMVIGFAALAGYLALR